MADRVVLDDAGTVVDARNSIHLGARGPVALPGLLEYARDWGYELIPGVELDSLGVPAVVNHIRRRLAGRPVYLCFDMDVFDPSVAPAPRPRPGAGSAPRTAWHCSTGSPISTLSPSTSTQ